MIDDEPAGGYPDSDKMREIEPIKTKRPKALSLKLLGGD